MKENSREERLQKIIELSGEISKIQNLDVLFEFLLTEARKIVNADAGSVYIVKNERISIRFAQNSTLSKRLHGEKLPYVYFSFPINENSMAGYVTLTGKTLNIQDAYNLPEGLPFEYNRQTDEINKYHSKSLLTMPLKTSNGIVLGILQIINARDSENNIIPFDSDAEFLLSQLAVTATQAMENANLNEEMINRTLSMSWFHDPKETYPHVERVSLFSLEIYDNWADKHNIPAEEKKLFGDNLKVASKFHDIGKVGVSDLILKKNTGPFTPEERALMESHTAIGAKMFINGLSKSDKMSFEVALHHHEFWDGSAKGYPGHVDFKKFKVGEPIPKFEPMKGEEIPLAARIVAVADVFDALSHRRCYKDAWTLEDAILEIQKDSGTHFDPEVVNSFMEVKDRIISIFKQHPDDEEFAL